MDNLPAPLRSLKRRLVSVGLSLTLALAALLALRALAEAGASATGRPAVPRKPAVTTFAVTTTVDSPDSDTSDHECHDLLDGGCSLRAAVQQLDADSGGTINLPAGTVSLTDDGNGDLQLGQDIIINGVAPGASIIQGGPGWSHRILRVQNGAQVVLFSVTISGGNVPGPGGGIDVVSGTLSLLNARVTNNKAGKGGGIYNGGRLTMVLATIDANVAYTSGGGIFNEAPLAPSANLTISISNISNNLADNTADGGGLYNLGRGSIGTTTFSHNVANNNGGGLANEGGGRLVIQASTVSSNTTTNGDGGGLFNIGASSVITLVNSTVSGNNAGFNGGGLANDGGITDMSSVTVVLNVTNAAFRAGGLYNNGVSFRLRDSLVALNTGFSPDCGGPFDSQGYNLVQSTTGCLLSGTTGNVIGQDPKLASFGLFGGTTAVWRLLGASPALDAGNPGGCRDGDNVILPNDQRGFTRTFDGNVDGTARCDIGAYELVFTTRLWLPLLMR